MNTELKLKLMSLESTILVSDLKDLVASERKLKAEILHYLWVVQQKRIFAEHGYSSLFEFCMKHLGYTEAESLRRISAMRLLGEIPEIENKISEGSLSLSAVAMAQSLFRQEAKTDNKFTKEEKVEVLKALENKTVRECEKEILKFSTQPPISRDKVTPLSQEQVQVSFSAPKEFIEKLEKLKAMNSHKNPFTTTFELLNELLDKALEKTDSQRSVSVAREVKQTKPPKTLTPKIKRIIWQKYNSQCSYTDPKTGQKCISKYFLEVEHIKPRALGGTNNEDNLKLYCRAHNQLSAIHQFGFAHMNRFINQ